METEISIKHWQDLSKDELYDVLSLRTDVFVVEQNCSYQECDGVDKRAYHLLVKAKDEIIGTTRIIPEESETVSLGRIAIKKENRMTGLGKKMVKESIAFVKENVPSKEIKISAQVYLLKFYSELGFVAYGEEYLEDDIPHIAMKLSLS